MNEKKDEERSCQSCEYFFQGSFGSRINPPEDPECGMHFNVRNLPNWPFKNGCKNYKKKVWNPMPTVFLKGGMIGNQRSENR